MRVAIGLALLILGGSSCATSRGTTEPAAAGSDEVRKAAEAYLNAMTGAGDDSGRDLLLGGATANAKLFALENWKIVREQSPRHEEADVARAVTMRNELDEASREAMARIIGDKGKGESLSVEQITPAVAAELMAPTQASADRLMSALPVMGSVLQVGKSVYWNPKNPARAVLAGAGTGSYVLDLQVFDIESTEGPRKVMLRWPLKVLRFKTAQLDTGWKVLPASDWNAE